MQWETGRAIVSNEYSYHCNIDNTTCYQAKTVPVIFNMSAHTGYSSGGQNLTVYGHGFGQGNITASLDGVACNVTKYQERSFSCEVQAAQSVSALNVDQPGGHGLRRTLVTKDTQPSSHYHIQYSDLVNPTSAKQYLAMQFETPYGSGERIGNKMKGYFVAPKTTRYRFYLSCNEKCTLDMGLNASDPTNITRLIDVPHATYYRKYKSLITGQDFVTDWISLEQGQSYPIEAQHIEKWWTDHLTVSVEVEQSTIVGHPHSVKELQYIEVRGSTQFERV
jgi:hypothetical protein